MPSLVVGMQLVIIILQLAMATGLPITFSAGKDIKVRCLYLSCVVFKCKIGMLHFFFLRLLRLKCCRAQ